MEQSWLYWLVILDKFITYMKSRNGACEQICDCKESDTLLGEFIKGILKLQNCGINKHLEEFTPLHNI